jgi:prevent-host-death family protein
MAAKTISVTELKQNLGEIVNQASFGGTRFILLSHGKERAALISVEDLRLLETLLEESQRELYQTQQLNLYWQKRANSVKVGQRSRLPHGHHFCAGRGSGGAVG